MKRPQFFILILILATCMLPSESTAKIAWSFSKSIVIGDEPLDIAITKDQSTAYVLCKKHIVVVSLQGNKVTDKIPLSESYGSLTIADNHETLLLTKTNKKEVALLNVTPIYDLKLGNSPIIGPANAPVAIYAFLDFQ